MWSQVAEEEEEEEEEDIGDHNMILIMELVLMDLIMVLRILPMEAMVGMEEDMAVSICVLYVCTLYCATVCVCVVCAYYMCVYCSVFLSVSVSVSVPVPVPVCT